MSFLTCSLTAASIKFPSLSTWCIKLDVILVSGRTFGYNVELAYNIQFLSNTLCNTNEFLLSFVDFFT